MTARPLEIASTSNDKDTTCCFSIQETMQQQQQQQKETARPLSSCFRKQQTGDNKINNVKYVSFCPESQHVIIDVPNLDDYSVEEYDSLWFSGHDFNGFRDSALTKARQVRERYANFQSYIEEAHFEIVERSSSSSCSSSANNKKQGSCNNKDEQQPLSSLKTSPLKIRLGLRNWCRQPDFRGLEKWVSPNLREHREMARDGVCYLVALSKSIDNPSQLSQRYQEMTRSNVQFARLIGEADAITTETHIMMQGRGVGGAAGHHHHLIGNKISPVQRRWKGSPILSRSVRNTARAQRD